MNTMYSALSTLVRQDQLEAQLMQWKAAARQSLSRREWAAPVVGQLLTVLPNFVTDAVRPIQHVGGVKEGSINHAIWCAVLYPLFVTGFTSKQLVSRQLADIADWEASKLAVWTERVWTGLVNNGFITGEPSWVQTQQGRQPRCYLADRWESDFNNWVDDSDRIKWSISHVRPMDWQEVEPGRYEGVVSGINRPLVQGAHAPKTAVGIEALKGINALQSVPFTVNEDILDAVFQYADNCHRVNYESNGQKDADLLLARHIMSLEPGKKFWFPVTCDWRGRMYYRAGMLTPQGKDMAKAAFQFGTPVTLGSNGHLALYIAVANTFGKDKLSFANRLDWVEVNMERILAVKSWHEIHPDFGSDFIADEPFQAWAFVRELQRLDAWVKAGNDRGSFASRMVVHMDGSQNGYQHQAAIVGDMRTAQLVNLVPMGVNDTPNDAYMAVVNWVVSNPVFKSELRDLAKALGRNGAKNPVMTSQYAATVSTFRKHLADNYAAQLLEYGVTADELANAYATAVDHVLPACKSLINIYKMRFTPIIENGVDRIKWTTPDGFEVVQSYRDNEWRTVRAGSAVVMLPGKRIEDPIDKVKMVRAIAANFIQSMDATHMRMVATACRWSVVGIHDSVGCHAGTYFATSQVVREQFARLHSRDVLNEMLRANEVREANFISDFDPRNTAESIYMFS